MKILILGHKGMLGSELMMRLSRDHDVTGKGADDFDLASPASCLQVVDMSEPDVVVNAAAYTDVDGAEGNRDLCFAVNAEGVRNLVGACQGRRIKIVHFSTDYVFDGVKGESYTEDDRPQPLNVYGASKLAGERYLQEYPHDFLLIRTAWLYGKKGRHFVQTILEKAKTEKKLTVVDDQRGSPTYAWDCAGAVQVLLEGGHCGTFHITNRGLCSWFDFARKILHYAGLHEVMVEPSKSQDLGRAARRPAFSGLSGKKFIATTGKSMRVWQLALEDFMVHFDQSYR